MRISLQRFVKTFHMYLAYAFFVLNMKDRRKASGQEIADIKLRHGLKLAQKQNYG